MKFRNLFAAFVLVFFSIHSIGQNIELEIKTSNESDKINNGVARVIVKGGTETYTYKWSDRETSLNSLIADKLTEGKDYSVLVTDAEGNESEIKFMIPAESADEKINSFFFGTSTGKRILISR